MASRDAGVLSFPFPPTDPEPAAQHPVRPVPHQESFTP
jgi:hypothetical protein